MFCSPSCHHLMNASTVGADYIWLSALHELLASTFHLKKYIYILSFAGEKSSTWKCWTMVGRSGIPKPSIPIFRWNAGSSGALVLSWPLLHLLSQFLNQKHRKSPAPELSVPYASSSGDELEKTSVVVKSNHQPHHLYVPKCHNSSFLEPL